MNTFEALTLHQFVASHFNEKARWALDFKGLKHDRVDYLPGPHAPRIKKLSGKQTHTPLLQHASACVSGSANIIDWLERQYPDPPLYPDDEVQLKRALDIQSHYDEQVGPAVRTVIFAYLVQHPGYLCRSFSHSKAWPKRMAYRLLYPLAKPLIAKANKVVDPADIKEANRLTEETLEKLAHDVKNSDYLAGDNFSVADLTVASLLAPLASIQHPDMRRMQPVPDNLAEFLSTMEKHPALQWVQKQYQRHRPASAAI